MDGTVAQQDECKKMILRHTSMKRCKILYLLVCTVLCTTLMLSVSSFNVHNWANTRYQIFHLLHGMHCGGKTEQIKKSHFGYSELCVQFCSLNARFAQKHGFTALPTARLDWIFQSTLAVATGFSQLLINTALKADRQLISVSTSVCIEHCLSHEGLFGRL